MAVENGFLKWSCEIFASIKLLNVADGSYILALPNELLLPLPLPELSNSIAAAIPLDVEFQFFTT